MGYTRNWIGIALLLLLAIGIGLALDSMDATPISNERGVAPPPKTQRPELKPPPTALIARRSSVLGGTREQPRERINDSEQSTVGDEPPEEEVYEEDDSTSADWLAEYGLPTDTPVGPNLDRYGPPDPLNLGNASLTVRLFDKQNGQPIAGTVVLWQLDAPANELWQAGDQDVAVSYVPRGGYTFEQLAGGEFRPLVLSERRDAPEADAFDVGGHTTLELFIEVPRPIPVRLKLPAGREPLLAVESFPRPVRKKRRSWGSIPAWVQQRIVQPHVEVPDVFSSSEGEPDFGTAEIWTELHWLPELDGCYDAGFLLEDQKGFSTVQRLRLRVNGQPWPEAHLSHTGRTSGQPLLYELTAPSD